VLVFLYPAVWSLGLIAGITADLLGLRAAIWLVAGITAASGVAVAVRMYETHSPASAGSGT